MAGFQDLLSIPLHGASSANAEQPRLLPGSPTTFWQMLTGLGQQQPQNPSNIHTTADATVTGAQSGTPNQSFWATPAGSGLGSLLSTLALGGLGAGIGAISSPGARGLGAARGFGVGSATGAMTDIAQRRAASQIPANYLDEQLKANQQKISEAQTTPDVLRTYVQASQADPSFQTKFPTLTDYVLFAKAPNDLRTQITTAATPGQSPIPNQNQYLDFSKSVAGSKAQPNDIMKSYDAVYGSPPPGQQYDKDKMIGLAGALAQAKRPDLSNDDQKVIAGSMTMNQMADEAKKELLSMDPKLLGRFGGNIDKALQWAGLNDPEQADHFRKFLVYKTALADEGSYTFLHRGSLQAAQYFEKALPTVINTPKEIASNIDAVKNAFGLLAKNQLTTAEFKKMPFDQVLQQFYGGPGGSFQVPSGAKGNAQSEQPMKFTPDTHPQRDAAIEQAKRTIQTNPNDPAALKVLQIYGVQ